MKSLLIWILGFTFYPENADARRGSECCSSIGWLSPPSVTRSNITVMSGPNRLFFMVVTLPKLAGKMLFPVISVHMLSIIICSLEQHHLPLSPTPMGCAPLPLQPVMTQFPLTLAYFKSSHSLVFQKPPGNFPDMDPFPSSPLTAPLHSCEPRLVLAIDNSRPAASILGLGNSTERIFREASTKWNLILHQQLACSSEGEKPFQSRFENEIEKKNIEKYWPPI